MENFISNTATALLRLKGKPELHRFSHFIRILESRCVIGFNVLIYARCVDNAHFLCTLNPVNITPEASESCCFRLLFVTRSGCDIVELLVLDFVPTGKRSVNNNFKLPFDCIEETNGTCRTRTSASIIACKISAISSPVSLQEWQARHSATFFSQTLIFLTSLPLHNTIPPDKLFIISC